MAHGYVIQEKDRSQIPDNEWRFETVPQIWLNGQHVDGGYQGVAALLGGGQEKEYAECTACEG